MKSKGVANLRSRPPFEPGNAMALQHGGFASPIRLAPRAEEIAAQIAEIVPASSPADAPTIALLGQVLARLETVYTWLDKNGLMDARNRPRAVLRFVSAWETTASRLFESLGLTPRSRAALGLDLVRSHASATALESHLRERYGGDGEAA